MNRSAVVVLGSLLGGCALIIGIERRPLDPGPTSGDGAAEAGSCVHATVVSEPDADSDAGAGSTTYIVAVKNSRLGERSESGSLLGFDLDGVCTCGPDATDANRLGCIGADPKPCDLPGGIDNKAASIAVLVGTDPSGQAQLNAEFACGRNGFLLAVQGYNGLANDQSVAVGIVFSAGIQKPHDDADTPACPGDDAGIVTYAPRWDGTDRWSTDTRSVVLGTRQPVTLLRGWVHDWQIVVQLEKTDTVALPVGPIIVEATQGIFTAHVEPLDATGQPIDPTSNVPASLIRLTDGQFAGRVPVSALLQAVARVRRKDTGTLCPGNPIFDVVRKNVCDVVDVTTDPAVQFQNRPCDAISAAIGFRAEPARIEDGVNAIPQPPDPCDASVSCE